MMRLISLICITLLLLSGCSTRTEDVPISSVDEISSSDVSEGVSSSVQETESKREESVAETHEESSSTAQEPEVQPEMNVTPTPESSSLAEPELPSEVSTSWGQVDPSEGIVVKEPEEGNGEEVEVHEEERPQVEVRVTDSQGRPVEMLPVRVNFGGYDQYSMGYTDEDGRVTWEIKCSGPCELIIREVWQIHETEVYDAEVTGEDGQFIELIWDYGHPLEQEQEEIKGHVTLTFRNEKGQPIKGAGVYLVENGKADQVEEIREDLTKIGVTDAQGIVIWNQPLIGEHYISVQYGKYTRLFDLIVKDNQVETSHEYVFDRKAEK